MDNFANLSLGHHRMYLHDQSRNKLYFNALKKLKPGSVAVDIGSGSGILSIMAIRAGCKKVYAIEVSERIFQISKKIAEKNGFGSQIEFIKSDIMQASLPEKVDVILHDQIGDFLWDEGMVQKVGFIRDKYLKPDGKILPAHFELKAFAANLPQCDYDYDFWTNNPYQLDLQDFRDVDFDFVKSYKKLVELDTRDDVQALSEPITAAECNLYTDSKRPEVLDVNFKISKSGQFNAIVMYFNANFDEENIMTSNPYRKNTHWLTFALPVYPNITAKPGDSFNFKIMPNETQIWDWSLT